jgi:multimeric flavodoxin WrbA/nitrite reductase/ring-hydroxylating ferredoxin subunit
MQTNDTTWIDVGAAEELAARPLQEVHAGSMRIALSCVNGEFGAVSGVCNHVGGPLGQGRIDGEFVVCPWHEYRFHRCTGSGEPGYEGDRVPSHAVKEEHGRVLVSAQPITPRGHLPHAPHPLARKPERADGPIRVAGISTTIMQAGNPRYSTSEALLDVALAHARDTLGAETQLIKLRDLQFRHCEGYYSRHARACTWPCSITQADPKDQMQVVYEAAVHWADVLLIATPIRWGAASSLYFKMIERMNCIQNQITLANRVLIQRKTAAFIVTGGQDNVQAVVGAQLAFFAELGFVFPPFPFVAHSLGWTAENMERNILIVQASEELRTGTRELTERAIATARDQLAAAPTAHAMARGGRKAQSPTPSLKARFKEPS